MAFEPASFNGLIQSRKTLNGMSLEKIKVCFVRRFPRSAMKVVERKNGQNTSKPFMYNFIAEAAAVTVQLTSVVKPVDRFCCDLTVSCG